MTEETKHEFYVAGVKYHNLKTCIKEIEVGAILTMTPEPSNKYDPNAVRLEFPSLGLGQEIMVGYVPAKISASISAALMVSKLKCEVIEVSPEKKTWEQLKVVIEEI